MRNKLLLCLLSSLLLSLGWLGVSGLPLLAALVPLLVISRDEDSSRRGFWRVAGWTALTFGLWSAATTWWIWNAAAVGAIASVIITVLLSGGAFMLWHYVSKRAPKPLSYTFFVSAWIAAEYLYTVGEISFPWLTLGNGFANDIRLVQWYDATGVFGGSLWALACNLLLLEALTLRGRGRWLAFGAAAVIPAAVSLVKYAAYATPQATAKVAVVQPNIDPYAEKFSLPQGEQTGLLIDLARRTPKDVSWIITPETALSEPLNEEYMRSPGYSEDLARLDSMMRDEYPDSQLILGATTTRIYPDGMQTATARRGEAFWYDHFNTVMAIGPADGMQLRHKSLLVTGVEMTPYYRYLRDTEFFTVNLGGVSGQLGVDPEPTVFRSPGGVVTGAAVCWEGVYGGYMGGFVRRGAQMLFIISNDGWWGDTPGYRQLFAYARLRAVELRRSVARSANTGVSGLITPRGDVACKLGWDVRGTLVGSLPLNDKVTFYARYGDLTGRLSSYVFVLSLLYFIAYRVKRKNNLVK